MLRGLITDPPRSRKGNLRVRIRGEGSIEIQRSVSRRGAEEERKGAEKADSRILILLIPTFWHREFFLLCTLVLPLCVSARNASNILASAGCASTRRPQSPELNRERIGI